MTLSKKKLVPLIQYVYEKKAPPFANIDKLEEKFEKHYGKYYSDVNDFYKVLKEEESYHPLGDKIKEVETHGKVLEVFKVSLDNEDFLKQNFNLQAVLPFFIDGASIIEPSPFWKYFLIYEKESKNLLAYTTVFEAHHHKYKFRARISQVLVLPPYQR